MKKRSFVRCEMSACLLKFSWWLASSSSSSFVFIIPSARSMLPSSWKNSPSTGSLTFGLDAVTPPINRMNRTATAIDALCMPLSST